MRVNIAEIKWANSVSDD